MPHCRNVCLHCTDIRTSTSKLFS